MEFFTILLSSLLGLVAPVGLVVDRTAENAILSQLQSADQLQVRVDNAPSYQLLQGKVERVRIAGRGLKLKQQDLRIAMFELETDPIDLEPQSLSQKPKLRRSLLAGVHLVLEQQDLNQALRSPKFTNILRRLEIPELSDGDDTNYELANPQLELLSNGRVRFQVELVAQNEQPLVIKLESGLNVASGRQLQLVKPVAYVNQEEVTQQLTSAIAQDIGQTLDLGSLETYGLQARIIQLKVEPQRLEIVAFLGIEPSSQFLQNFRSLT